MRISQSAQAAHKTQNNMYYVKRILPLCAAPSLCSVESTTGSSPSGANSSTETPLPSPCPSPHCCTDNISDQQKAAYTAGITVKSAGGERVEERGTRALCGSGSGGLMALPRGGLRGGTLQRHGPMRWRTIPGSPIHKCSIPIKALWLYHFFSLPHVYFVLRPYVDSN